jgi:hypothetical protein
MVRQVATHLHLDTICLTGSTSPPEFVSPVPRLALDLEGLLTLLHLETLPAHVIHSQDVVSVFYGFGDALGAGFGDTMLTPQGVTYRSGIWSDDLRSKSSSYQELFNLTEAMETHVADLHFPHLMHLIQTLEQTAAAGHLITAEVFLFTDDAIAEATFYKGTSSNCDMFLLVLRLRQLDMTHSL